MSDEMIIRHCAPTLAGIKTGCMFSYKFESRQEMKKCIRKLNRMLGKKGLRVLPLRTSGTLTLIYVFRPNQLAQDLLDGTARALLESCGYTYDCAPKCVVHLVQRLSRSEDFPHEIGLFLGYPPVDVLGFIENNACGYKYSGLWKVYGDEEYARSLFDSYKQCTRAFSAQWAQGVPMEHLAVAL